MRAINNKSSIIIDTGFFVALFNKKDQHHLQALKLAHVEMMKERSWISTWPVMVETCHLLARHSTTLSVAFLESYRRDSFTLFALTPEHTPSLIALVKKYSDLPMDLADASLVLLAEQLGHGDIMATDRRDFHSYRWKNNKPFHNLFYT